MLQLKTLTFIQRYRGEQTARGPRGEAYGQVGQVRVSKLKLKGRHAAHLLDREVNRGLGEEKWVKGVGGGVFGDPAPGSLQRSRLKARMQKTQRPTSYELSV